MFKKTVLFVFASFFFVSAAFAAVNINKADQAALEALPEIGAAKAAAIIEYRTKHGNFKTKEKLLEVKGVGPKILEKSDKDVEIQALFLNALEIDKDPTNQSYPAHKKP